LLHPTGKTYISRSLYDAAAALGESRNATAAQRVVILLTDGQQNAQFGGDAEAIRAAREVRDNDPSLVLMAVGFGTAARDTIDAIVTPPVSRHSLFASSVLDIAVQVPH